MSIAITADPFADTLGRFVRPTIRRTARPIVVTDFGKGPGVPIARTIAAEALAATRLSFARRFDAREITWVGDVATPTGEAITPK